jgi:ribonuclease D
MQTVAPFITHLQGVDVLNDLFELAVPELPVSWVDSSAQLNALCVRWKQCAALALDTEFIRERTFYPIIALIQITDGEGVYLIDPLMDIDFTAFKNVLVSPDVIKVFHACSEDLDVFECFCGVIPSPVFDTQIAAVYCGMDAQMGYQRLVKTLFGIDLGKHETRSNWLQRPLSDSQLSYAVEDVRFLLDMHKGLSERLKSLSREQWAQEECQALISRGRSGKAADQYYLKFSNACHFSYKQQRLLQKLCVWREKEARRRDLPRSFILPEGCLLPIAEVLPRSVGDLPMTTVPCKRELSRYGADIVQLTTQVLAETPDEHFIFIPLPLRKESKPLLEALKHALQIKSKHMALAPELLLGRKSLEKILRYVLKPESGPWQSLLTGWREEVLLPTLTLELQKQQALIEHLQGLNKAKGLEKR